MKNTLRTIMSSLAVFSCATIPILAGAHEVVKAFYPVGLHEPFLYSAGPYSQTADGGYVVCEGYAVHIGAIAQSPTPVTSPYPMSSASWGDGNISTDLDVHLIRPDVYYIGADHEYEHALSSPLSLSITVGSPISATVTIDNVHVLDSSQPFCGGGIYTPPAGS